VLFCVSKASFSNLKGIATMTKLLSKKNIDHIFATQKLNEVLSCRVGPKRPEDEAIIDECLQQLGFTKVWDSTRRKLYGLLASFLLQAARLEGRKVKYGEPLIIGWPHAKEYWQGRSEVGYKIAKQLRDALVQGGWITYELEARINLGDGDSNCSGYLIREDIPAIGQSMQFISSDLVVQIRIGKEKANKSKNKAPIKAQSTELTMAAARASSRIRAIWKGWEQHPYVVGSVTMTNAQRVFNNGEMTRGGRLYGAWTNMKKEIRLNGKIDGKAVAEVDVRGMNLTLLSAMSCEPSFSREFDDPYACGWNDRGQVKAYLNEMIGAGYYMRWEAADMCIKAGLTKESIRDLRDNFVHPKFPCLKLLKKGVTDALLLAYHESEIMLLVVEKLNVPVYILHDCLICRAEDSDLVGNTLQDVFSSYCQEKDWAVLVPAYTIDQSGKDKKIITGRVA
jgi:hypothetical protein